MKELLRAKISHKEYRRKHCDYATGLKDLERKNFRWKWRQVSRK